MNRYRIPRLLRGGLSTGAAISGVNVLLSSAALAAPASQAPVPASPERVEPSAAVGEPETTSGADGDVIEVEEITPDGRVISRATYDASGHQVVVEPDGSLRVLSVSARGSGSGGSSSSSGCRKATVRNKGETVLGYTAYWYNTWTQWCWNRSDHVVSDVVTGQYFEDVASTMYYRRLVVDDQRFYAWKSGYNKSGHWHERQAQWENCIAKYGCISNDYPRNIIRAHSDGTFSWNTTD